MQFTSDIPFVPNQIIDRKYQIERILGRGGMGVVALANHLVLEEKVAIKFLLPAMASNPEVVTRFVREAKAAIKIRSQHVARIMDVSTSDMAVPFLVMEYLEGRDLSELLQTDGPLPIRDAVGHVLQACEALGEAHAQGIVHRDLKPANLFLTHRADGSTCVKVLDFGISKVAVAGEGSSLTRTQGMMGSPLYMSPEQARSARSATVQSDIWSMGVVLYELLTGTTPFTGTTLMEVCVDLLQKVPPPPSVFRPEVSAELDAIIMKCIEKDPANRYGNMAEFAVALAPLGAAGAWESARVTARVLGVNPMAAADRLVVQRPPEPPPSPPLAQSFHDAQVAHTTPPVHTVGSWGATSPGSSPKRRVAVAVAVAVAGVLVLLVAGGVGMLWWGKAQVDGQPEASSAGNESVSPVVGETLKPGEREEPAPRKQDEAEIAASAKALAPGTSGALPPTPVVPPSAKFPAATAKPPASPPKAKDAPPGPTRPPKKGPPVGDLDLFNDNK